MSDKSYAMPTTGNVGEDERQMAAFILRTDRMDKNICPNGCGQMDWIDPYSRECKQCGFWGFSSIAYDMNGGTA